MAKPTRRESGPGPTRREPQIQPTRREDSTGGTGGSFNRQPWPEGYKYLLDLPAGGEADCYLLEDTTGKKVFCKHYRPGVSPKESILERLKKIAADKVVERIHFNPGTSQSRAVEILEYMEHGSLDGLFKNAGYQLSTSVVRAILVEIVDALNAVHKQNIEHRDLKPENVLIRSHSPLDLVLTDFGISSETQVSVRKTSMHQTIRYAPPEAGAGAIYKTAWDCWSLGIMLVEMLTGRCPFSGQALSGDYRCTDFAVQTALITHDVESFVANVDGDEWVQLCRGLLRRDPKNRWTTEQVVKWLANPRDPELRVAEERATVAAKPFPVGGQGYSTPEDLAKCFAEDRERLERTWKEDSGRLILWLANDLGHEAEASQLEKIRTDAPPLPFQLMRVLFVLDPSQPPRFEGEAVTHEAVRELADAAIKGNSTAAARLVRYHKEDIVARAAALAGPASKLDPIVKIWRETAADYAASKAATCAASEGLIQNDPISDEALGRILAAATPNSKATAVLRRLAASASTPLAQSSLWYQSLGDARNARPAIAQLLIELAPAAEAQVASAMDERAARNWQLWWQAMGGAGIGSLIGVLGWGGTAHWHSLQITMFDVLFLSATLAAGLSILISVHQKTSAGR